MNLIPGSNDPSKGVVIGMHAQNFLIREIEMRTPTLSVDFVRIKI
jgi:hypothetical protein